MPLTYVWLSYFLTKYGSQSGEDKIAVLVTEFTVARGVFDVMLSRRLGELVQIWSQQKQHLPTQVNGYCAGIFSSYYDTVSRLLTTFDSIH